MAMRAANSVRKRMRKVIGDYELGKQLGKGKFGVVKLVTHVHTGNTFAMKVINKKKIKDSAEMVRIRREAEVLTNLDHPYIVNLQEVFETTKYVCIVMEYAAGGDLFHYIVKQPSHRLEMTAAVAYCHVHYVVHRDLKPEKYAPLLGGISLLQTTYRCSIFLDENKNVKIGDFGFSRTFRPDAVLDTPCGSLAYAAPEVISGKVYSGPAADLWSLACIFYVMMVGELPFDADTDYQVVQNIKKGNWHDSPHLVNQTTRKLLRKMLHPNPKARISLGEVQRSPVLWQDRPLLGMLVKPFADVFAAKKPYSESAKPLLHRSFSDSEISSIETGVIKPFRREDRKKVDSRAEGKQRRSSVDHGAPALGMEVREVAITTKESPQAETEATVAESKGVSQTLSGTSEGSAKAAAEPTSAQEEAGTSTPVVAPVSASPPASATTKDGGQRSESAFQPPVITVDDTEELAFTPPTISASAPDPSGEGSDVEVILVLPDLSDDDAPPMVVLERTWDSSGSLGSASESDLAEDEIRERLPSERPPLSTMAAYIESSTFSGNTLQVPQFHRRRNSHSFCDETVTTLFTTHKHPKERFRL